MSPLDRLVRAAGLVDLSVTFDKFGLQYVGWLKKVDTVIALVGADSCEDAALKLASRLAEHLEMYKLPRYQQALALLPIEPGGLSTWERLRNPLEFEESPRENQ